MFAVAVRVGSNDEDSASKVRRPDVEGRKRDGGRIVTKHVQVSPHRGQPSPLPARDVLDDDPRRADLFDDSRKLKPETGASSVKACSKPGRTNVLARLMGTLRKSSRLRGVPWAPPFGRWPRCGDAIHGGKADRATEPIGARCSRRGELG